MLTGGEGKTGPRKRLIESQIHQSLARGLKRSIDKMACFVKKKMRMIVGRRRTSENRKRWKFICATNRRKV